MSLAHEEAILIGSKHIIRHGIAEILTLTSNDLPQAWGMAAAHAQEIADTCRKVEEDLARRYQQKTECPLIAEALAAVADEPVDNLLETVSAEDEAARVENAHVSPHFAPMLAMVTPHWARGIQ